MKLSQVDQKKLAPLLDQLTKAIEDLLLTGLTTASESTRQILSVSAQEASRIGLLRLGATLRVACEELSRYTTSDPNFSRQRFSFFLNRSWLISRGLAIALNDGNEAEFERLSWTPSSMPLADLSVVCLAVSKKVVPSAFCAFDFRLRVVDPGTNDIPTGQKLVWSAVFPMKVGQDLPAEGFLLMPQKQKFKAIELMEGKILHLKNAAMSVEKSGLGRLTMTNNTSVLQGEDFTDWNQFATDWDPLSALERLQSHAPGPLDLDIEMQEEVVLRNYKVELPIEDGNDIRHTYPIRYKNVIFRAVVSKGVDGDDLEESMKLLLYAKKPPVLFGLLHYERCRLTLQPLTLLNGREPEYLNINRRKIDPAELLKVIKF